MSGWSERVMGQKGFFDVERRLEAISGKGDPLETIKTRGRWEDFRAYIESAASTKRDDGQWEEESEGIRAGEAAEGGGKQAANNAQKGTDGRWTKKNDESFYGYKNHVGVDKAHKLIRKWDATDAAVHDSQKLDDVLDF